MNLVEDFSEDMDVFVVGGKYAGKVGKVMTTSPFFLTINFCHNDQLGKAHQKRVVHFSLDAIQDWKNRRWISRLEED